MKALDSPIDNFSSSSPNPGRGRKMCPMGKSCGATCIHREYDCLLELSLPISNSLKKASNANRAVVRESTKANVIAAHPSLAKDYSESNIKEAFKSLETLDKDAPRRVSALLKLLDSTKTLFLDWKDKEGNKTLFLKFFDKTFSNPLGAFNERTNKSWKGAAYKEGATVIQASPGFKPNMKQVKTVIDKQLSDVSQGKEIPFQIGQGVRALGNSTLITLVHELGHQADFKTNTASVPLNLKSITKQAQFAPMEPFAELFAAYIFSGPKMEKLFPNEYRAVEAILKKSNVL